MMKFQWVVSVILLAVAVAMAGESGLRKVVVTDADWSFAISLMTELESSGKKATIGDQGESFGILQIQNGYLGDALDWARRNSEDPHASAVLFWDKKLGGLTAERLLEAPSTVPYNIVRCYMVRWAGKAPTLEWVLRIHNGGPFDQEDPVHWRKKTNRHVKRARDLLTRN